MWLVLQKQIFLKIVNDKWHKFKDKNMSIFNFKWFIEAKNFSYNVSKLNFLKLCLILMTFKFIIKNMFKENIIYPYV